MALCGQRAKRSNPAPRLRQKEPLPKASIHPFFGKYAIRAPVTNRKEQDMKHDKSLRACNDMLKSLQTCNGLKPEFQSELERVRRKLNRLKRGNFSRKDVFEVVKEVAAVILKVSDERN
jgi:hypothetical protein